MIILCRNHFVQGPDMIRFALTAFLLTFAAAQAQTRTHVDGTGTRYSYCANDDGGVLTPMDGGAALYLGRSCDAHSPCYGTGTWFWANAGFSVEFPDKQFGFARQELYPNSGPDCGS